MIIFLATNGESIVLVILLLLLSLLFYLVRYMRLMINFINERFLFTFINYTMKLSAVIIVRNHYCLFSIGYFKN